MELEDGRDLQEEEEEVQEEEEEEEEEEQVEEDGQQQSEQGEDQLPEGEKWHFRKNHPDNGTCLRGQVLAILQHLSVSVDAAKLSRRTGNEAVRVRCRHHVSSQGGDCEYAYVF